MRFSGVAARGSMARASARSSVVTETAARASRARPIGPMMSASRRISPDLVMIENGWPKRSSVSSTARVTRSRRSCGW